MGANVGSGQSAHGLTGAQIIARLLALGAGALAFPDNVFSIVGSSDATKIAAFEVDGFTTGTTRTFTLPDASITVAGINLAQTFSATQTFAGIDATSIGATTRGTGLFTTLGANGAVALTSTLAVTGLSTLTGGLTTPAQITSTIATGTAPLVIASTTVVGNLNVSQLLGATWAAPGTIGSGTPSTGAFTTLSATGTATLAGFTSSAAGSFIFAGATMLTLTNTNASASNAGGGISARSDDGAALASGDRLGHFTFAGAKDASHTIANPCRFEGIATENWSSTATGTKLALYTCPNTTTSALVALTLDQDQTALFASTIIAPAGTTAIPSLRIPHGVAPTSPTNGDVWTTTAGVFVRINGATVGPLT